MKSNQYTILTALAAANQTSAAMDVNQAVSMSFQFATADATAAGTFKVQASNDNNAPSGKGFVAQDFVPTNWADITSATATVVAGVAPMVVIPNMCFKYVRVVFTRTAGAGTFSILTTAISP